MLDRPRGRDLETKAVPTLNRSIAASNPPEPPEPSPGTIDAYITGGLRHPRALSPC